MTLNIKLQQELKELGDLIQLRDSLVGQLKNVNQHIDISVKDIVSGKWHNVVEEEERIEF